MGGYVNPWAAEDEEEAVSEGREKGERGFSS